jgi:hypothetical protein
MSRPRASNHGATPLKCEEPPIAHPISRRSVATNTNGASPYHQGSGHGVIFRVRSGVGFDLYRRMRSVPG